MDKKFIIKIALFCALLTLSGVWLQGCKRDLISLRTYNPIVNTKLDSVRIFNLLPDSSKSPRYATYALYVNDSLFYSKTDYSYNNTSAISGTPPVVPVSANGGAYVFKIARYTFQVGYTGLSPSKKPDPKTIIYTSPVVNIVPHSGFSNMVFYVDANGAYNAHYFPQATTTEPAPDAGKYKIRVVNFGYHIPSFGTYNNRSNFPQYPLNSAGKCFPVQLQYADSTVVSGMGAVPFATATPYVQMNYGTQQFLVYNSLPDSAKYIKNSYLLSDMGNAFGLGASIQYNSIVPNTNQYPYYTNYDPGYNSPPPGTALGNISSYPFNAGGVYTIYIFGNMYNAVLDKQYGDGTLDNFGQLQVVNANFNQQNMQVNIHSQAGDVQIPSLPFGLYTSPAIVPAGNVTVTFSSQGTTLFTYQTQIPRLGNYTLYYTSGLNNIPTVFPQSNNLNTPDFSTTSGLFMQAKIGLLNISPDAGAVFATGNPLHGYDSRLSGDFIYETIVPGGIVFDGRQLPPGTVGGVPDVLNIRLTSSRADSLASKLIATAGRASLFRSLPAPGTYTLAVAGLLNTTDPAKKLRIIMVKQSNFISKAQ